MHTYRTDRSYDWNYQHGPVFTDPLPEVPETPLKDFFGVPVFSRMGISAGLLLNSRWIGLYARLGYDILTYKTVRIRQRKCYALPNWLYVNRESAIDPRDQGAATARRRRPRHAEFVTSTVSFGMPSAAPEVWMADVEKTRRQLAGGQALIVSVVASPQAGAGRDEVAGEFGDLAAMAREAGAHVIEANLSCPNVTSAEGGIFMDADLSGQVAAAMRRAAGDVPVLLKVGFVPTEDGIAALLRAVDGQASGVVMVNGISRRVVDETGKAAFGAGREMAGILGRGIHAFSLGNVRSALEIKKRHGLALEVVAVGGVSTAADAERYFDAGAYAVMMGSAPMFRPLLAVQFKKSHPEW